MGKVTISLDEYKRLIKVDQFYNILLSAVIDATKGKIYSWGDSDLCLNNEKIFAALELLDKDGFEGLRQRRIAEAEAKKAEEEEKEAEKKRKEEEMIALAEKEAKEEES